jgi:hypothetical protein
VCVCSLRYPPRNVHAPYCHLWPVRTCSIFQHYLINGRIFEKTLLNTKLYVHVTVHRDMWPCIVTCDRASWHVTVHRDMWPCIVTNFLTIKPTRCTNFSKLFWNETLHVSDSFSVHYQQLFTVHSAMVYVIQVGRQLLSSSRIRMELQFHPDPALFWFPL